MGRLGFNGDVAKLQIGDVLKSGGELGLGVVGESREAELPVAQLPVGGFREQALSFDALGVEGRGRRSAARLSTITLRDRPVTSSSFSVIVTPSTMSPNFTMPPTSLRIGTANASHSARS